MAIVFQISPVWKYIDRTWYIQLGYFDIYTTLAEHSLLRMDVEIQNK